MASAAEHFIHYEDANSKVRSMSLDGTEYLRSMESLPPAGSLQHGLFDAQASISRLASAQSTPKAFGPAGFNSSTKAPQLGTATAALPQQQHAMPPPAMPAAPAAHTQPQQQQQQERQQQQQQHTLQQSMQQTYQSIMATQPPRLSISDSLSKHAEPYALPGQPSLPPVRTMTGRTLERLFEEAESAFGVPLGEATSMPLLYGTEDAATMGPILRYNSSDVLREFGAMLRSNSLQVVGDGSPLAAFSYAHQGSHGQNGSHGGNGSNGGSASTPVSGDGSVLCSFPPPSMPMVGHGRARQQSPFGIEAMHPHTAQQQQQQQQLQSIASPSPVGYRREGGKQMPGGVSQPPATASPLSFSAGAMSAVGSPGGPESQNRSRSARTSFANPGRVNSPTARHPAAAPARHSAPSGQLRRKLVSSDSASDDSSSFSAGDGGAWRSGGDVDMEGVTAKGSAAKRPRTSTPSGKARPKGGVRKAEKFADNKGGRIHCYNCGTHQTPQWRCGPEGPRTLCNACGVRFKKGLPMPYLVEKKKLEAAAAAAAAIAAATAGAGAVAGGGVAIAGVGRAVSAGAVAAAVAGGSVMGPGMAGFGQASPHMMMQPAPAAIQHSMYGRAGQFVAPSWL